MSMSRRALAVRPVKSLKHEITWSNLGQNASSVQTIVLVEGIESPVNPEEVDTGSIVKSIYVEFNLNGIDNSGVVQVFHWAIYKSPANAISIIPSSYQTDTKKFIIKRGMEMLPEIPIGSGGTVQTKRVFTVKLPRSYKRFDDSDQLNLSYISTSASAINFCGFVIYKEFK